jgi:MFS family permease
LYALTSRMRDTYREYPARFWVLVGAGFIDRVGGTMLFPFFALYVTQRFSVGMTEAGLLLGTMSLAGLAGSTLGGALTDKYGRRGIVLFGLIFSAFSAVGMGFIGDLALFYPLAALVGLLGSIADPARAAMVADLLPERQRAEGYGILRVSGNLAWMVGPTIGGVVAGQSYLWLFILDCITSSITALVVFKMIPETKPPAPEGRPAQGILQTLAGYGLVMRDALFLSFVGASMLMLAVYQQMYSTLSVYLRDVHGVSAQGFGFLLSLDAAVVVVCQIWITRRLKRFPPMLLMAAGTALYMVGFSMYGFVSTYELFVAAILVITAGEMIVVPVAQALVARLAPEDMRGRYIAAAELSWAIPATAAPWAAGVIMDNYNPNLVWWAGGAICAVAVVAFWSLHYASRSRLLAAPEPNEAMD